MRGERGISHLGPGSQSRMEVKVWVKVIWEVVADDAGRTTDLD